MFICGARGGPGSPTWEAGAPIPGLTPASLLSSHLTSWAGGTFIFKHLLCAGSVHKVAGVWASGLVEFAVQENVLNPLRQRDRGWVLRARSGGLQVDCLEGALGRDGLGRGSRAAATDPGRGPRRPSLAAHEQLDPGLWRRLGSGPLQMGACRPLPAPPAPSHAPASQRSRHLPRPHLGLVQVRIG